MAQNPGINQTVNKLLLLNNSGVIGFHTLQLLMSPASIDIVFHLAPFFSYF